MHTREGDIAEYEGLVIRTAMLFFRLLGMDQEDLCQELRVKVWKAQRAYDPARSRTSEKSFVYGCVANFVKDLKKESARRAKRERPTDYIEDQVTTFGSTAAFELRYLHVTHEEVYGVIEERGFVLPATITDQEAIILGLLISGLSQVEIADELKLSGHGVQKQVAVIRTKLADWRPTAPTPAVPAALPAPRTAIAA